MPFRFRKGLRIISGLCLNISVERRLAPSAGGANRVRQIKKRERRHLESYQGGRRSDIVKPGHRSPYGIFVQPLEHARNSIPAFSTARLREKSP